MSPCQPFLPPFCQTLLSQLQGKQVSDPRVGRTTIIHCITSKSTAKAKAEQLSKHKVLLVKMSH